jgi:hypothetical protein
MAVPCKVCISLASCISNSIIYKDRASTFGYFVCTPPIVDKCELLSLKSKGTTVWTEAKLLFLVEAGYLERR